VSHTFSYEKQHYVSQVLLRRFTAGDRRVQRFCLATNKWDARSPKRIFRGRGYNQVTLNGAVHNKVDESLKKYENALPTVLRALDDIVSGKITHLEQEVYENLLWYCAHLWCLSPFAKAVAPLNYIVQLDFDLKHGRTDLLKGIGIHESQFQTILDLHSAGRKFIFHGKDYLQVVFGVNFSQNISWEFESLKYIKWTVYHSPIEIPVPDVAFLKFYEQGSGSHLYFLPIAPKLILAGGVKEKTKLTKQAETSIGVDMLDQSLAEYIVEILCSSGITALACNSRTLDIVGLRDRARKKGITFAQIKNLDEVFAAGTTELRDDLMLMPTTEAEYNTFLKGFIEGVKL
jgi:hypothetical protein